MNHNPSQKGLEKHRQAKKKESEAKIREAFESLKNAKKDVNINAVAKKAGLSNVTVYKYKELAEEIKNYRDKPSAPRIKKRQNVTVAQLQVINQGLEQKVEELQKENEWLKNRVEAQNGEIRKLKKKAEYNGYVTLTVE